jgi:hypothetical protein
MDQNVFFGIAITGALLLALFSSYVFRHKTSKEVRLSPQNSLGMIAGGVNGFALYKKYPIVTGAALFLFGVGLIFIGLRYVGIGMIIFILTIGVLNLIARIVPTFNKHSFISQSLAIIATLALCGLLLFEILILQ